MKKQIKQCKGFNADRCKFCKRQDDKAERTLVKRLAVGRTIDQKFCQYYLP